MHQIQAIHPKQNSKNIYILKDIANQMHPGSYRLFGKSTSNNDIN